ncbi:hypothetical protein S7711_02356 [Stachybotrys chartarum IBT 7711]|uniref:Stress-response A/B barrel domain-containing protein n=1 Tax=Stachybotrys chartarum (strain CBS 109288 / IBT 7711) TaxID=1280523 RepID=A0A084B120_STACB|nr:hypothetical protein S7711_02356 [Stachybotrys chartarum IBT 7711]KFA56429.1 hypothetical protein S40293_05056 [Stachybotrys chartarum IBT 40293]KFA81213.1 hypothetical protein S40288_07523 [Stachybotrys chartarum IBT 40288]
MVVYHIVLLQVKSGANPEAVKNAISNIETLKDTCVHRDTGAPYILSSVGGRDNSLEGLQNGITHVIVEQFQSEEDRQYYLKHEEGHKNFVKGLAGLVDKVQIVGFTPGVF